MKRREVSLASDGMEDIRRLCAIAFLAAMLVFSLRKQNAELAILIGLAAGILLIGAALQWLNTVTAFLQKLTDNLELNTADKDNLHRLFRAAAVSVTVHLTATLCRDAGETALAARLDLCGTALCIVLMLPSLTAILELLGGLI